MLAKGRVSQHSLWTTACEHARRPPSRNRKRPGSALFAKPNQPEQRTSAPLKSPRCPQPADSATDGSTRILETGPISRHLASTLNQMWGLPLYRSLQTTAPATAPMWPCIPRGCPANVAAACAPRCSLAASAARTRAPVNSRPSTRARRLAHARARRGSAVKGSFLFLVLVVVPRGAQP